MSKLDADSSLNDTFTMKDRPADPSTNVFPAMFWDRIKGHRKALGLTLDDLARSTGVSKKSLIRLEKGEDVKLSTLIRVLDSLQLSVDFAVGVRVLEPLPKNLKVKPLTEEEQYGWF